MNREGAIFGWRALIGWIHSLGMISHTPLDLHRLFPEGFGVMFSTLGKLDQSVEQTEAALGRLETMAELLAKNGAQYIIVNSYPMVTHGGPNAAQEIIARIRKAADCPATTTATAAVAAMHAMGMRRIVMCSPYAHENEKIKTFVEANGFEVCGEYGETRSLWEIHRLPAEYGYSVAKKAFESAPDADGLFLPGGRLRTLEVTETLEQDLGVPVVASTQAVVWQTLQDLRFHAPIQGYGRLLSELPAMK